jgi:hypothetical protein
MYQGPRGYWLIKKDEKFISYKLLYRIKSCGSGMFYAGSEHFSIPNPTFFIPDPASYIKRGMKNKNYLFSCSLWFQGEVLIVKKDKFIPDPGSGSASLG